MNKRTTTPPEAAFHFKSEVASIVSKPANAEDARKCSGTAYSGNLIRHSWWGAVVFDLSSTKANDPTPLLIGHDRDQRAGFATLAIQPDKIIIKDGTLLNNDSGQAVANESDAGFPWQLSVHIEPASIDELAAGASAQINGQTVTGPAKIFRNNTIREVSFTPTGVDNDTDALALSATTINQSTTDEDYEMTIEELKAKVAELEAGYKASQDAITAAEARAKAAEDALVSQRRDMRASAVKEMFAAIGREYKDESAAPYMDMSDAVFAAVSADLKAAKPEVPDHLFSAHATAGIDVDATQGASKYTLDPTKIYEARRAAK